MTSAVKDLLLRQHWNEICLSVFRRFPYALRGIADEQLLDRAVRQIPDGQPYDIVTLSDYPSDCRFCGGGKSHAELRNDLMEVRGEWVGIGQEPSYLYTENSYQDEVLQVMVLRANDFKVHRNQNIYENYTKNPQRYQKIQELWQE